MKVAGAIDATINFIRIAMEKPNPPYLLAIARKKEEEYKSLIPKI